MQMKILDIQLIYWQLVTKIIPQANVQLEITVVEFNYKIFKNVFPFLL